MKKRVLAILVAVALMLSVGSAFAVHQYDYEMKYLWDKNFDCLWIEDNPTFGELYYFQSAPTMNMEKIINSAYGEQTAKNFYTYITYAQDPMNPQLVAYWQRQGLLKEAFYDDAEVDDGIEGDYYVYSPVGALEAGELLPCVIVNHGGGEPAFQAETFGYCQIAARDGAILIMAETTSAENVRVIFEHLIEEGYPIDRSRVYATGSSAGGNASMSQAQSDVKWLAAIVPMDQPPEFRNGISDEAYNDFITYKMPMMFIGGWQDKYHQLDGHDDGTELKGGRSFMGFMTEEDCEKWNLLLDCFGVEGYDLTLEQKLANVQYSLNVVENYTGLWFEHQEIINDNDNIIIFSNSFTDKDGIESLRSIMVNERGHIPSGFDAEIGWSFMQQFTRDQETGMSIYVGE